MLGRRDRSWRGLWSQSNVPARAGTISVDQAPEAPFLLSDYGLRKSSGSLAIFAAVRRASSRMMNSL
jgi:hypothetical protein